MGGDHSGSGREQGGGPAGDRDAAVGLTRPLEEVFRDHWWAAVAVLARFTGDLELAEDAVQDACAAALRQWPADDIPASPRAWLISVARHKALDSCAVSPHGRREKQQP